jgi:hypothetical protein
MPQVTLCDRLEAYFKARPDQWIDGMELSQVAGCYAWRSRASDLRKRGLVIENRQRRIRTAAGSTRVVSEYRYVAPAGQLELIP